MSYKIAILAVIAVQAYISSASVPCVCPRNLKPVCGSDGETYPNKCRLECAQHKGKADLTIAKQGTCDDEPYCMCGSEYEPVCGSDGNTYPNRCAIGCKKNVHIVSEGECDQPILAEPLCMTTLEMNVVCGSDGKSYANPSVLHCAALKDPTLTKKHSGSCDGSVKI